MFWLLPDGRQDGSPPRWDSPGTGSAQFPPDTILPTPKGAEVPAGRRSFSSLGALIGDVKARKKKEAAGDG